MKEYKSVCPYDCPDACGLIVSVDNNKVISVRGDRAHAFTRGTLCPKMAHYEKVIHSPLRLKSPMKRVGKKGIGEDQYTRISWDEALDAIVNNFKETIDTYGSESILRYSYAGTMGVIQSPAADYFFRCIGATDQDRGICSPAKQAGFRSVYGDTLAIKPQEAQHSDLIVLWGINATATDVHILHDVNIAKKKGARVWIIDTHKTYTFSQAHEHIYVKPGSDGALALGMLHIIHRDGLADIDFIKKHVQGYDELVKEVLLDFTPGKAAEICGVSVERMTEFAHAYAKSKAPFIRLGSGLSRYGNGAMTCRAINALPAVVGAWQYPGGGLLSSASGSKFIGKDVMQQAHVHAPAKRLMPMIKLGEMLINPEGTKVHSLYIFSSNPAITAPDQNVVRRGLMRDDLFTVVHERFFTDTCKYADIILPATTSVEHDDIYNSYGHYTIGTGYKLIDPVGESRSNWQVIAELAKRMGLEDDFFDLSERELINQIVRTSSRISKRDQELILNGEPVEMTVPESYKMDFKTPSGKIELYNPQDVEPLIRYMPPYGDNAPFWLINGNDIRILDSSFCELDFNDPELMKLRIHPEDAKMYNINDGAEVEIYNDRGSVKIKAYYDDEVQRGTLVTLGVWWQSQSSDPHVAINALTAARPTDQGWGSTFYDVQVHIRNLL
ncbi:molybdopterin-dependent oxidoreductase [Veillonella parvula]|uniref:molybdopterin-containing oxidoreductase family protein n=1 Tax=Veillonella parvula TaxID=29466 RepID=UPI001D07F8F1|nr:molybdopterin-dependent oxidoreductase [Veillonella parvula]MCB6805336.1 molybdopterin-dependent oxidoreductase [Veillonella parvula]MCQ4927305.1 molybdopterin-dependent oxidoreductase [Veillonella parvula]MCQ4958494.1 molybdopterin-dependent oxidoreductase [Veillonella parvula]